MLNLENKTYVIMGIANKRSIAFGVAKVLDQLGAKLVFTYRKERSRKELEKLLEQLNQPEAHLYQIDVQSDEEVINGLSKLVKMLAISMVYIIQSHLLIWKTYADVFLKLHVKVSC
ncbi:enoyl-ACP reductase [Staphylococcus aureus]|nr:enoyl-ACP reductase [Staphylococcus aureus]